MELFGVIDKPLELTFGNELIKNSLDFLAGKPNGLAFFRHKRRFIDAHNLTNSN